MKIPFIGAKKRAPESGAGLAELTPRKRSKFFGRNLAQMFKASVTNKNDNWGGIPQSIDAFITLRQPVLVARSREQWSNNDYVRAFVRLLRQNVIGPQGVIMQAKVEKPRGGMDKDVNAAIEADWSVWGQAGNCDVTGQLSWRDAECLAVETAARDGEFIIRLVYGADAGSHGFAIQFIDAQRLPVNYENYRMDKSGGFIRQGIEFNRYGRPVAYHFTSTDEYDAYYYSTNGRGFVRVPADEIIHRFVHEVVGQRRGIPWASTSLHRLHHLQGFEDAAVANARAGATQMGFIQYRDGFGPENEDDCDVSSTIDAEPLSFHELPEGAELKEFKPQYPNGEFVTFHKAMLRGAAAGMGVLYNNVAGDLEGVNFSSIRQGTLDERERYKDLQSWIIEALHVPVRDAWLKWRLLNGGIKTKNGKPLHAEKLSTYKAASWQPRRWAWIDPKSDVTANVTAIRAGLTSPSQVIREQARDPEAVFKEIAEDIAMMRAAGIEEDFISVMFGLLPAPEASPHNADESVAKAPS